MNIFFYRSHENVTGQGSLQGTEGGGKKPYVISPPPYLPIEFPKYWSHDDETYFFGKSYAYPISWQLIWWLYDEKQRFSRHFKKSFSQKTAKIATFCDFRFYIDFPKFSKKIQKFFFSRWFKPLYIPDFLSKKYRRECVRTVFISFIWIFEKYGSFLNVFVIPIQLRKDICSV